MGNKVEVTHGLQMIKTYNFGDEKINCFTSERRKDFKKEKGEMEGQKERRDSWRQEKGRELKGHACE